MELVTQNKVMPTEYERARISFYLGGKMTHEEIAEETGYSVKMVEVVDQVRTTKDLVRLYLMDKGELEKKEAIRTLIITKLSEEVEDYRNRMQDTDDPKWGLLETQRWDLLCKLLGLTKEDTAEVMTFEKMVKVAKEKGEKEMKETHEPR